ncbi:MAG: hypothetical protein JWO75_4330 [Actinomycetia bacterium]|jgi:hypothetical protein|nr:hypothetical protein [Actinomycetes bacterium]
MMSSCNWRKSNHSGAHSHCVEAAASREGLLTRDSKDPASPVLAFTPAAWRTFVRQVKASGLRTVR